LIGKVRRLRSGKSGYRLLSALWEAGFGADSADGITVAEPMGVVPEFRMWLQRKVQGQVATDLLAAPGGEDLVRRIADAAHKVHRAGVLAKRRHTMNDELRILHERLPSVARSEPRWAVRIERLLDACDRLGAGTLKPEPCGIHRDFYADQVIVAGPRLCLIDFDLYCEGDPALDIGNFLGHIREQSLRSLGDPEALADLEVAMEERFVELAGEETRPAVRAYKLLTLARHVHLSTLFLERRSFTGSLLELCEEYLGTRC
jgi:aminoglycoside phosphotransferase (APT) family kinase protein